MGIAGEERLERAHDLAGEPVVRCVGVRQRMAPLHVHAVVQEEVGLEVGITTDQGQRLPGGLRGKPALVEDAIGVEVEHAAAVVEDHGRVRAESLDPGRGRRPHATRGNAHASSARAGGHDRCAHARRDTQAPRPRGAVEIGDDEAIRHDAPYHTRLQVELPPAA